MYAIKGELDASGIYLDEEVERFSAVHFKPRRRQSARDHQAMNDQTEDAQVPGRLTEERVPAPFRKCVSVSPACMELESARHFGPHYGLPGLRSYPFAASRLYPSRVCGSFRPRIRDATTVRRICAVPPPMVNIRASRAMRSSGRLRE